MLFSSPTFLFVFLPLVLLVYFLAGRNARNLILLLASILFYFWGGKDFIVVLGTLIIVNYLMSFGATSKKKLAVIVLVNLGVLIYYKYRFFLFGGLIKPEINFVPPLAISFFTFHAISYQMDIFRRQSQPEKNPLKLALYFLMFPHLLAGPILRFHQVKQQLDQRSVELESFVGGAKRFVFGLAKKLIIADRLALSANEIFAISPNNIDTPTAWLGIICFGLQIYFDFSAYSDMAIGLAQMLGFKFPENFNYPYISQSIREFWQRWHMTLSSWFRDYLYIPLGGNRKGDYRTYLNLVIVFGLCGLWHGANFNFIIWGLIHGMFLCLERFGDGVLINWMTAPFRYLYVFLVITLSWVFFRIDNLANAVVFVKTLFGFFGPEVKFRPVEYFLNNDLILVLAAAIILAFPVYPLLRRMSEKVIAKVRQKNIFRITFGGIDLLYIIFLLFLSYLMVAAKTYQSFIYFKF